MKEIKYEVSEWTKTEQTAYIEDDGFICVRSWLDGSDFITAFIGKGEGNNKKMKIEVSLGGDFLNFSRLIGDAERKAIALLKRDKRNKIVPKSEFVYWYTHLQKKYKQEIF